MKKLTVEQLLGIFDYHHIGLRRSYMTGWEAYVPDPGGHYMEDRIRIVGSGLKPSEAILDAMERLKQEDGQ